MTAVKLSAAQAKALRNARDRFDPYHGGAQRRVVDKLLTSGYIERDGSIAGTPQYVITDAGRAALDRVFGVKP